jgi:dTDP-4-dehydrorhamnose 3,5-epimerase-like enzyme
LAVGHGNKALGVEPVQLLYPIYHHCNPADEFRLPYNHPVIAYDWKTQHKQARCASCLLARGKCSVPPTSRKGRRTMRAD